MKKLVCILCIVLSLFSLCSCGWLDNRMDKEDIFELVTENQELILEDIENNNFENTERLQGIQEVKVCDEYIEFFCGGAGFGPATAYCGFYYTENDDITAIWCSPKDKDILTPYENGFVYQEDDNRYYTEKICDKIYYYEASF